MTSVHGGFAGFNHRATSGNVQNFNDVMQPYAVFLVGAHQAKNQTETTVRDSVIMAISSKDELDMIVSALSAYSHNTRYRAIYEKLIRQQDHQTSLST